MMRLRRLSRVAVALLLMVALPGVAACTRGASGVSDAEKVTTASVAASEGVSAESSGSAASSQTTPGQSVKPVAPADASELEKELRAIEKELDGLDLPSDSDFSGIEGDL